MSQPSVLKQHEKIDIESMTSDSNNDLLLSSKKQLLNNSPNSSSSTESSLLQNPNRRVVKSCFWSTSIFSINFISSILVINLSKWYED